MAKSSGPGPLSGDLGEKRFTVAGIVSKLATNPNRYPLLVPENDHNWFHIAGWTVVGGPANDLPDQVWEAVLFQDLEVGVAWSLTV